MLLGDAMGSVAKLQRSTGFHPRAFCALVQQASLALELRLHHRVQHGFAMQVLQHYQDKVAYIMADKSADDVAKQIREAVQQ